MAFYRTPIDLVTPGQIDAAIASVKECIANIDPVVLAALKRRAVSTAVELDTDGTHSRLNKAALADCHHMAAYFVAMLTIKEKHTPEALRHVL